MDIKQAYLLNKLEGHFLCFVVKIPAIIKEKVVTVKKKLINEYSLSKNTLHTCTKTYTHIHTHAELRIECQH